MPPEIVTYLEMTSPDQLRPARSAPVAVDLVRVGASRGRLYASTANRVGAGHDRISPRWTPAEWAAFFARSDPRTWVIRAAGEPAGVLATAVQPDTNLEIRAFGLVPELVGRASASTR